MLVLRPDARYASIRGTGLRASREAARDGGDLAIGRGLVAPRRGGVLVQDSQTQRCRSVLRRRTAVGRRAKIAASAALVLSAAAMTAASAGAATGGYSVTIDGKKITTNAKLAASVPAKVRSVGLSDITYNNAPPDEQVVNGTNVGWEIDLGRAVAAELGLKWKLTTSGNFDGFIPGTAERALQRVVHVVHPDFGTAEADRHRHLLRRRYGLRGQEGQQHRDQEADRPLWPHRGCAGGLRLHSADRVDQVQGGREARYHGPVVPVRLGGRARRKQWSRGGLFLV